MILIFEDKDENILDDVLSLFSEKIQIMQAYPDITQKLTYRGLSIHPHLHRVVRDGREVSLSRLEFATLFFLANHPGWVFSKAQIYEAVWKEPGEYCGTAVANVISQIRRKIGSNYITTVIGSGYRFEMG